MNSPTLIIFEGLENTNKNLQIEKLKNSILFYNPNTIFTDYEWNNPAGNSNEEMVISYQDLIKEKYENFKLESNPNSIHIWNKSYLREYVYGRLHQWIHSEELS